MTTKHGWSMADTCGVDIGIVADVMGGFILGKWLGISGLMVSGSLSAWWMGVYVNATPYPAVSLYRGMLCAGSLRACVRSLGGALMSAHDLAYLSSDDLDRLADEGLLGAVGLSVECGYCLSCQALTALDLAGYCLACAGCGVAGGFQCGGER